MSQIDKIFNFEIKQVGPEEDRVLRFVGSDETPDRDNDIIEVAGWKLDQYLKNSVFLWAHKYDEPPIGKAIAVNIDATAKKLMFDIKFPTADEYPFADTIYKLYKGGYLNATSVGFAGIKFKTRDDPEVLEMPEWRRGKRYMEQELLELSAVPVPANPNALISVRSKGFKNEDIEQIFIEAEIETNPPDETKALAVIIEIKTEEKKVWKCPHCQSEIGEKELYFDQKNWYHSPCKDVGPILFPEGENGLTQTKKLDLDGNPSVWDILYAVHKAINPAEIYQSGGPWVEDLYPVDYPSGHVILEKDNKYYLYQYTYDNGTVTLSTEFTELEEIYSPKSYGFKSGAALSAKNREMLNEICDSMKGCGDRLRKFIDTSGLMGETDPPPDKGANNEIAEIKQALEEIKTQVLFLSPKTITANTESNAVNVVLSVNGEANKDINLNAIELPKGEIDLDAIEFVPAQKNAETDELDIQPDELKNIIGTLLDERLKNFKGGN